MIVLLPAPVLLCAIILFGQAATGAQSNAKANQFTTDCGYQQIRRDIQKSHNNNGERHPKIIEGLSTREGQFPWQASLELLHPSMGFLGHWCGAVLIHQYWILSAAHCVHNDLFNLPIPPLWTVVLGEHDRLIETGYEQRIPVEKVVLHDRYENFLHDLVLMKLSMPADLTRRSHIGRICLPSPVAELGNGSNRPASTEDDAVDPLEPNLLDVPEKVDNFLRRVHSLGRRRNVSLPSMKELLTTKILSQASRVRAESQARSQRHNGWGRKYLKLHRRRNDKLMKVHAYEEEEYDGLIVQGDEKISDQAKDLPPYVDCVATGWGKSNMTSDLADILLKTRVPLHNNRRCREAYGSFVKIHRGHLCAGMLDGKGGTCVGDSGGPLQCRLSKNGPWILAGITSFGSGCAIEGFPDVYMRTSYYMKWIQDTIAQE